MPWYTDCIMIVRWDVKGISDDNSPTREVSGICCRVIALPLITLLVKSYLAPEASPNGSQRHSLGHVGPVCLRLKPRQRRGFSYLGQTRLPFGTKHAKDSKSFRDSLVQLLFPRLVQVGNDWFYGFSFDHSPSGYGHDVKPSRKSKDCPEFACSTWRPTFCNSGLLIYAHCNTSGKRERVCFAACLDHPLAFRVINMSGFSWSLVSENAVFDLGFGWLSFLDLYLLDRFCFL